jgi:hypothetical protein
MTKNYERKQISKAIAVLMTLASLLSITAAPAIAADETWNIDVYVTDSTPSDPCDGYVPNNLAAMWSPDPVVSYPETQTNDIYYDDGSVPFGVSLNFSEGYQDSCLFGQIPDGPDGSVVSTFTPISSDITGTTSCDSGCNAYDVYLSGNSQVSGTLDVTGSNAVGTRSGSLSITWTPAD